MEIEKDEAARCARYPSVDVLDQARDDIALAGRQLAAQERAADRQAVCDALADQEQADG